MKKKVYVSTFYSKNYGSALQAFALQKKLKELNCSPCVLKQINNDEKRSSVYLFIRMIKRFIWQFKPEKYYRINKKVKMFKERKTFAEREWKIDEFCDKHIEFFEIDLEKKSRDMLDNDACCIVGSDQVWNIIDKKITTLYSLGFLDENFENNYSYAASIGLQNLSRNQKEYYVSLLSKFKVISFREELTVEMFHNTCLEDKIRSDVDPTLLFDGEFWKSIASESSMSQKYVFIYMLRPDEKLFEMARKIAFENELKIVYIGLFAYSHKDVISVNNAGVEEFLSYILNAEYVVTNSFHGTCFSLQFHKKFVSVKIETTGVRVKDLLNKVGIASQLIDQIYEVDKIYSDLDYAQVDSKLESLRVRSVFYLNSII